jgi:dihydrofolate reductase
MDHPTVSLIAIVARNGAIGKDNALLLHLPEDLAHFKRATLGAPIVMGRKTWESIGRALPGRRNVVVTRNADFAAPGAECVPSLAAALERLHGTPKVWVIGGAALFAEALPLADELVLTELDADLEGDVHFPAWDRAAFRQTSRASHRSANGVVYSIVRYQKIREGT